MRCGGWRVAAVAVGVASLLLVGMGRRQAARMENIFGALGLDRSQRSLVDALNARHGEEMKTLQVELKLLSEQVDAMVTDKTVAAESVRGVARELWVVKERKFQAVLAYRLELHEVLTQPQLDKLRRLLHQFEEQRHGHHGMW